MSKLRAGTRLGAVSQDDAAQHDEREVRAVLGLIDPDGPERLLISKIRRDGGTQPRAELNQESIAEYAEDMKRGDEFPPGLVFCDGADYWLARGFTRTAAAESLGWIEFDYIVKQGTRRDAVLFSVGENADHGLRRTNADKRRAVLVMLEDEEWGKLSSEIIAKHCKVSHTFVNNIRRSLATVASQGEQGEKTPQTRVGNDGREYRVDRIQKTARKPRPSPRPASTPEPVRNLDESDMRGWGDDDPRRPSVAASDPLPSDDVPTEADEKAWIVGQLKTLAGLLDKYGRPGDARIVRQIAAGLVQVWRVK